MMIFKQVKERWEKNEDVDLKEGLGSQRIFFNITLSKILLLI